MYVRMHTQYARTASVALSSSGFWIDVSEVQYVR